MVKEVYGDLLKSNVDVICHQTNYAGVMGGGIAYAIQDKLLTPKQYEEYVEYCRVNGEAALGTVQYIRLDDGRTVANIFSQSEWVTYEGTITDYAALRKCLEQVKAFAEENRYTVGVPGYIGCGIAGGDWSIVRGIIEKVFVDSPVELIIVYLQNLKHAAGPVDNDTLLLATP